MKRNNQINNNSPEIALVGCLHKVEPSDGLVTAGSQHYDAVPADRVYRAIGANHLEAGNHPEVTRRINDAFDRGDQLGIGTRIR